MVQPRIKYLDILWLHRWFAVTMFSIVLLVVLVGSALQKKVYKSDAEIYIAPKPVSVTGDSSTAVSDYDYRLLNNQIEILSSDMVVRRALKLIQEELGSQVPVSAGMLRGSLMAAKKDYTTVITVSLTSGAQPKHLQRMLELYLKAYQNVLAEINSKKSNEEKTFLEKQLLASEQELAEASEKLRAFEATNQTYNMDAQLNQMLSMASRMDENSKTLSADIAATRREITIAKKHLSASPEYINLMARVERDTEVGDLRKKIVNTESEQAEWSSKLTNEHPKMVAYDHELNRLHALLKKRLDVFSTAFQQKLPDHEKSLFFNTNLDSSLANNIINNEIKLETLRAKADVLAGMQRSVKDTLQGVPKQALTYAGLKNQFEISQDKVKVLQKRLDDASLMEEVSKSFTRIESLKYPTLPVSPLRPNMGKNMMAAVLLGLCLSLFSVFVRATMDRTLRWPFQVTGLVDTNNSVFTLPALPSRQVLSAMLEKTNFNVPEPYKRLIIHLENLSKTDQVRRIGVLPVSPFPECGMTTIALSLYLTELSNKLVLIDTDYSRQSVSSLVAGLRVPMAAEMQEGAGLSDYLNGQTEDFIDVIHPLGKTVYGSFIPAGPPVQETGFQFSHRNLGQLEQELSPNYNFVLYSLPAIEQSYDAVAVGRTLDGVMLVVHPEMTGLDQLHHAIKELEAVNCRLLGVLVQPV